MGETQVPSAVLWVNVTRLNEVEQLTMWRFQLSLRVGDLQMVLRP